MDVINATSIGATLCQIFCVDQNLLHSCLIIDQSGNRSLGDFRLRKVSCHERCRVRQIAQRGKAIFKIGESQGILIPRPVTHKLPGLSTAGCILRIRGCEDRRFSCQKIGLRKIGMPSAGRGLVELLQQTGRSLQLLSMRCERFRTPGAEATQCRWKSGEIAERRAGVYFVIVSPVRRLTLAMMSYSAAIASLTYLGRLLLDRLVLS